MIRKIDIPVSDKVFTSNDILQFARVLFTEFSKKRADKRISFELKLPDGSSYEIRDEKPDSLKQILKTKKVKMVAFDYYDFAKDTSASIRLDDGNKWGNSISIESSNSTAFNNLKASLDDVLTSVKPQENFYTKHKRLIKHVVRLYFGFLVVEAIVFFVSLMGIKPLGHLTQKELGLSDFLQTYRIPITLAVSYLSGLLWGDSFIDYLDKLWPSIEFDFGPEHLKTNKQRRKIAVFVTTVILIPLALQLIFVIL